MSGGILHRISFDRRRDTQQARKNGRPETKNQNERQGGDYRMTWRQELKYLISEADRELLLRRLPAALTPDPYAIRDGLYQIRPLCLEWKLLGNYIGQRVDSHDEKSNGLH